MFDLSLFFSSFPRLLEALPQTLALFGAVVLVGLLIGIPVGLIGQSQSRIIQVPINFYIGVFRGTPALVQLFFVYYGLGQFDVIRHSFLWSVLRDPFYCAVIALGLNSGAYTGRIVMSAITALPKGIVEGAQALGLSESSILLRIKIPLALRFALPAYSNETILNMKATSLASTVTIMELMGTSKLIVSQTYAPYEIFIGAGIIYIIMCFILSQVFKALESWVDRRTGRIPSEHSGSAKDTGNTQLIRADKTSIA